MNPSATLKQRIHDELNILDGPAMAAVYEHLRHINRLRDLPPHALPEPPDINQVLRLTATSEGSWSDTVSAERDERS